MRLLTMLLLATLATAPALAHHSYSAYDMQRLEEIPGVVDEITVVAPHSLIRVRGDNGRLYVAEWLAPAALTRLGVDVSALKSGDRVVLTGNPHRDIATNGILNFRSLTRPADGLHWTTARR